MDEVVKVLYERFLMRDLLGKVSPGFVAVVSVLSALQINTATLLPDGKTLWLRWVVAIAILFLTGLALQIFGERLGVHSASPRPRHCFFFFGTGEHWLEVNLDFERRTALFHNIPPGLSPADAQAVRERFVYLKEGSGNMGLAIVVALICILVGGVLGGVQWTGLGRLLLLILCLVLFASHWIHAQRQAVYEIRVLNATIVHGTKLLSDADAQIMLNRIGKDTL